MIVRLEQVDRRTGRQADRQTDRQVVYDASDGVPIWAGIRNSCCCTASSKTEVTSSYLQIYGEIG